MGLNPVYNEEFKKSAVEQVIIEGLSQAEVCKALNVSSSAMSSWVRRYSDNLSPKEKSMEQEMAELRKRNQQLEMENEILKKATAIFSKMQK